MCLHIVFVLRFTDFKPFFAGGFNAPCQYTLLLNLRPLIFGLTPLGWLHSVTLTPTHCLIY